MRELSPAPVGVSINETMTSDMRDTGGVTAGAPQHRAVTVAEKGQGVRRSTSVACP